MSTPNFRDMEYNMPMVCGALSDDEIECYIEFETAEQLAEEFSKSLTFHNVTIESGHYYPVNIPKTERICVTYKTGIDIVYFITKKELTIDNFFIYQYDTSKSETIKLGKGNNPILLEQKYIKKVS